MTDSSNSAGATGYIEIDPNARLLLFPENRRFPFGTGQIAVATSIVPTRSATPSAHLEESAPKYNQRGELEILMSLFGEDKAEKPSAQTRERIQQVVVRNLKAVKDLKALYKNNCQISGDIYAFKKRNGQTYCEVHHLIALGEGGADDPRNMIVVNPLIHRMLHYAEVTGLNLSAIQTDEAGESTLEIQINGQPFTITWNRDHARRVLDHSS